MALYKCILAASSAIEFMTVHQLSPGSQGERKSDPRGTSNDNKESIDLKISATYRRQNRQPRPSQDRPYCRGGGKSRARRTAQRAAVERPSARLPGRQDLRELLGPGRRLCIASLILVGFYDQGILTKSRNKLVFSAESESQQRTCSRKRAQASI